MKVSMKLLLSVIFPRKYKNLGSGVSQARV